MDLLLEIQKLKTYHKQKDVGLTAAIENPLTRFKPVYREVNKMRRMVMTAT